MQGLYLNTPPKPKQAYKKRKPRGHTTKSLEVADSRKISQQGLEARSRAGGYRNRWSGARVRAGCSVEVEALCDGHQSNIQQVEVAEKLQVSRQQLLQHRQQQAAHVDGL